MQLRSAKYQVCYLYTVSYRIRVKFNGNTIPHQKYVVAHYYADNLYYSEIGRYLLRV